MIPALTSLGALVSLVASQKLTTEAALVVIRDDGGNADRDALATAVAALQLRDCFIEGVGDPYSYVGVEPGINVRAWDLAVQKCETEFLEALEVLAAVRP